MTRVLLVIDANADLESRAIAAQISAAGDPRLACTRFTLPPAGAMPQAVRRLAQLDRAQEFDVLHAVGTSSLLAVLPIGCQPIVYSPPADDPVRGLTRMRWISLARKVTVACGTEAVRQELIKRRVPRDATRVVKLAPSAANVQALSRETLGLAQQHKVMLAVGESTPRANHRLAAWTAVILYFFDHNYRMVMWGRGPMVDVMRRYTGLLRQPGFCVFAEEAIGRELQWQQVAAVADLALLTATEPIGLHAARICQQLGVPIVAAPSAAAAELAPDNLAIASDARARVLAQTVHNQTESGALRRVAPSAAPKDDISGWITLYDDALVGRAERTPRGTALAVV